MGNVETLERRGAFNERHGGGGGRVAVSPGGKIFKSFLSVIRFVTTLVLPGTRIILSIGDVSISQ